jgi:hypothetical protein
LAAVIIAALIAILLPLTFILFPLAIGAAVDAGDDVAAGMARADVVVDFSSHSATEALLELAIAQRKPVVIGTTGHSADAKKKLLVLAAKVPCVWAGNFSVGVNLLFALTRRAASVLGADYDAEVIEMHHRFKQDAPSDTAARLLEIILEERRKRGLLPPTGGEGPDPGSIAQQIAQDAAQNATPKLDPTQDIKNVPPPDNNNNQDNQSSQDNNNTDSGPNDQLSFQSGGQ